MFTVVIPARYRSTRLPGKPLATIAGKPMIQHVYQRALESDAERVIVATDDQRIADVVAGFGGLVCMTQADHASGTDRIQEVAAQYQLADESIVVNVQGDEPLIPPAVINQVANNLSLHTSAAAATLSEAIVAQEDYQNPNIVKVVRNHQGFALYFSRAGIPYYRDVSPLAAESQQDTAKGFVAQDTAKGFVLPQRHIGIYAYRVSLLNRFVQWPVAALEQVECLEQLRILENGEAIHIDEAVAAVPGGVDTPEDLQRLQDGFLS